MTNSIETLGVVLTSQLQSRLANAKPALEHIIQKLEKAAATAGEAYGLGTFRAPTIDAQASLARNKPGDDPVRGVAHYVGHANSVVTKLMAGASSRLSRKAETPDEAYLALAVVEDLLRTSIRAKAGIARLEAAANEGPFASGKPDFDRFESLSEKVSASLVSANETLGEATSGEDVVRAFAPAVKQRLAGNNQRVRETINAAVEQVKGQDTDHAKNVAASSVYARETLGAIAKAARTADATDLSTLGAAAKELYGLHRKCPFYFGLPLRGKRAGKLTRAMEAAKAAEAQAACDSTSTEASSEDAA